MQTHFEIQAALRTCAARCENIYARKVECDKRLALEFLIEAICALEMAKMVGLVPLEMVPSFLRSFSPSPRARAAPARRKQPRPRRATPQYLLRFVRSVADRRAKQRLTQATQ